MKTHRKLLVLTIMLLLSSVMFGDEWNKTYNVTGTPTLKVKSSDATVSVTAWDNNTIQAHVSTDGYRIGPDGIRIIENQVGNTVEIEVRYPHENFNFGFHSHNVEIDVQVPRQSTVGVRTGDGRIRISGIKGDVDSWSGDGSQEIESIDGSLRAGAGDGNISVTGRLDALDLNTGDGRIEVTASTNSKMLKDWNLHTGDGSVTVRLPESFAAEVDLHTSDGHISLDLPVQVSGKLGENDLHGKLNGGGKILQVHTGDGSIHIERS